MSKKESDAEKICKYLEQQNRPFSVNDIMLNLHKEVGKTAVQKCLDSLCLSGSVKEKVYGKQKVYVSNQSHFPALDEAQLKQLDVQVVSLTQSLTENDKKALNLELKLKNLCSSLTTEEAQKNIVEVECEVSHLRKKLEDICGGNQVLVTKEQKEKVQKENVAAVKEWKKRKRLTMDMLDAILEGYPKSKKELFEEVGIETDEEAGIKIP